jgi:hypothetical protein
MEQPTEPAPFPEEDLSQFPVVAAEALAALLDQLATNLDDATAARSQAGSNLGEFEGTVADQYRTDLGTHEGEVTEVIERFRTTAGRLRDAVEDHRDDRQRMLTGADAA